MKIQYVPFIVGAIVSLASSTWASIVTYEFNISWVTANPDGAFPRPVIGINDHWPLPTLRASVGDTIIVNVCNNLGNQSTSLHFHGLSMKGSPHMDGTAQGSQCGILPGASFQYNFTVHESGTYWYHSHYHIQYPDGLRGLLIIDDPNSSYKSAYDAEIVLSLSDWYHHQMSDLLPTFMSASNRMAMEPMPDSNLMNDSQNISVPVEPNSTYLFRLANIGAFMGQYFWIEGHNMSIVEVDGVYTLPAETEMVYLAAGQRCSVLVTTREEATRNYPIIAESDTTMGHHTSAFGWLEYNSSLPNPEPQPVDQYNILDDMTLIPYDEQPLLPSPSTIVTLNMNMKILEDGINHWTLNNISYSPPETPTLHTALTSGDLATLPETYTPQSHPIILNHNETVQIVINNRHMGRHPFHLHGHQFQAVYRSEDWAGSFLDSEVSEDDYARYPMRRDTIVVNPGGSLVLRFQADNPGVWLFHCHMEWHAYSGLVVTFVEAPMVLQRLIGLDLVPGRHFDVCSEMGGSLVADMHEDESQSEEASVDG
ncbi:multicopper oxidase [Aspergillus ibericus CBS 121593]|uniref:Multicopper oxidase n=1 Tax=Aspergillus ibericus CBS 121593 TaxID=1448316 RepID=A0A395GIP5_9EURO|nr:multicopper oxidase [Aspergillus ibericus CBS 121593]RAK94908.1 multicopper oxidase [Aspergillus ibericus CBS 121593]